MIAIVNFRTLPNGSFRFMQGLKRGFWRVLVVADPNGSTRVNSHNVIEVLYQSYNGILGVTSRSKYNLEYSRKIADDIATKFNTQNSAPSSAPASGAETAGAVATNGSAPFSGQS